MTEPTAVYSQTPPNNIPHINSTIKCYRHTLVHTTLICNGLRYSLIHPIQFTTRLDTEERIPIQHSPAVSRCCIAIQRYTPIHHICCITRALAKGSVPVDACGAV